VPNERFHVMPRPLPKKLIDEIVAGYGAAARRMRSAGMDGCEIVASHGYLPSQFLNPRLNRREDEYGGPFENRLRFLYEVIASIRREVGRDFVCGLRISGEDMDHDGQKSNEALEAIVALEVEGQLDYYNVIAGSSASIAGAVHIVPPMIVNTGYVAPFAATVKAKVKRPVFVAGRINQPQIASILAAGADVRRPGADLRSGDGQQGAGGSPRRHPRLHRLQPGLHRAFPSRLFHLLHPAS
jgi:2,4-dienoyl-CoA reductase-like NADH-dependent reductase (Old Yellow Enzyme family)